MDYPSIKYLQDKDTMSLTPEPKRIPQTKHIDSIINEKAQYKSRATMDT